MGVIFSQKQSQITGSNLIFVNKLQKCKKQTYKKEKKTGASDSLQRQGSKGMKMMVEVRALSFWDNLYLLPNIYHWA